MKNTEKKVLVSVVLPAYNEAAILHKNLQILYDYTRSLDRRYTFEFIIVNDGSSDDTGAIAENFAASRDNIRVYHHIYNFRLGQALRTGFKHCRGHYVVVLDIDLSYSPEHIEPLVRTLMDTGAELVVASPYMKGGQVSNVPWLRKQFSYWANKFLSFTATSDHLCNLSTLTGMTRGYDANFLKSLNLKAMDVDINTEILYKSMILRARILEIPAHLAWKPEPPGKVKRASSMHIAKAILSSLVSGFTFRPLLFFILPGFVLLLLSFYPLGWLVAHTFANIQANTDIATSYFPGKISDAIALAFSQAPHGFIVGGFSMLVAIQLISLGILAIQKKKYFEELFHVTSMIKQHIDHSPEVSEEDFSPVNRCQPLPQRVETVHDS